ncbi:restriction endonuclease subunit S [Halomonas faecis]|uniref:restriction endonuclease subunit S n=1 Tax=Halomonas faecis TaxID=1562110 RepID=UPI0013D1B94E|nr:restriction endonuclease subunit S [Halomonas faecis]
MSFPKYPEYKDSGVEWLGEVPAHWDVERLKHSVDSCRNGIWGEEPAGDSSDLPCVRVADFDRPRIRVVLDNPTMRNVKPSEQKGRVLKRGDLVLEKSGGGEKQPVGFVVLYDDDRPAVCSNFTAKMELSEGMNPSFWRYVHAAAYSIRLNVPSIKQTSGIQNLDQQSYLDERAAYPPSADQAHIAAFLDHETARIDALVEQQQRLIELLKEKRQAVISHAVMNYGDGRKGKLGYYVDLLPGYAFPSSGFEQEGMRLLRGANIGVGEIDWSETVYWPEDKTEGLDNYKLRAGDLVFGMDRPWIKRGARVSTVDEKDLPAFLLQRVARLRAKKGLEQGFLRLILISKEFRDDVEVDMTGVSVPHISPEQICTFKISLPSEGKQAEICQKVSRELARLASLIATAESSISLMQERRSALISAAVTGKIDVRGWQPPAVSSAPSDSTQTEMV